MKTSAGATFLLCVAILVGGGCSNFNHDWKQAARNPGPFNNLEGRWQGVWVSEVTGHTDKLRCVITRKTNDTCQARFHAKYRKVLSFGYTVPLKLQAADGVFLFQGEANLGWIAGGVYHYEGRADATNFHSTYSCKYDHGTFQLARP